MQYKVWKQLKEMGEATSKDIAGKLDISRHSAQQALRRLGKKRVVDYELVESPATNGTHLKKYHIIDHEAELPKPQVIEI